MQHEGVVTTVDVVVVGDDRLRVDVIAEALASAGARVDTVLAGSGGTAAAPIVVRNTY